MNTKPMPKKMSPLRFNLTVTACLALFVLVMELFVFPITRPFFSPPPQETPVVDSIETEQKASDPIKDESPGGPTVYDYDYDHHFSDGFLVTIDGEELDVRQEAGKTEYSRYIEYGLEENYHDHDLPFFVIWF